MGMDTSYLNDLDHTNHILKIISIVLTLALAFFLITLNLDAATRLKSRFLPRSISEIATIPYTTRNSPSLGRTIIPLITVPIRLDDTIINEEFLLDSGAFVSTLPLDHALDAGLELHTLKRILLQGATAAPTFGYLTQATLDLPNHPIEIPVVFAPVNTAVLGRHGLFDQYTFVFDHQNQAVSIGTTP